MSSHVRVTDKDHGYNRTVRSLERLAHQKQALQVGIIGAAASAPHGDSGKATVGQIAAFAELGLGQPERSWLRAWFDIHEEEIKADLRKVVQDAIEGKVDEAVGMERLGLKYVGQIQQRIADGIDPPNADSTIARKKSSTPLIDTGILRSAVSYLLSQIH